MYDPYFTPSEADVNLAFALGVTGSLLVMGGLCAVIAASRRRANPGDAGVALGSVMCLCAAHMMGQDRIALWAMGMITTARALFAVGVFVEEFHNPTYRRTSGETMEQRLARRRQRDCDVAREAVARYEASLRSGRAPGAPTDLKPHARPVARRDALPPPRGAPVDAEFTEVDEHRADVQPARQVPAMQPDGEVLVRFETPIDADDVASRPDRARAAMDAILRQLGEGSAIVGIRARR